MYNKRINFAPVGRPTRKVRCTLLAGYAQRSMWKEELGAGITQPCGR